MLYRKILSLIVYTVAFAFASGVYAITVSEDITLVVPKDSGGTGNVTLESGSTFDSFIVDGSSLNVTLSSGQSFGLSSSDNLQFTRSPSTETSMSCGSSTSSLNLAPTTERTYVITMGAACTNTNTTSSTSNDSSTGGSSTSGGGGGGSSFSVLPLPPPTTTPPPPVSELSPSTPPATDLAALVELLIALEIIPPDKADQARAALAGFSGGTSPGAAEKCNFTRSLTVNVTGEDVRCLQQYLNSTDFTVASSGPGSPGNETTFFGPLTRSAVAKWQAANNVSPPVGYFGPISRAKYDSLVE